MDAFSFSNRFALVAVIAAADAMAVGLPVCRRFYVSAYRLAAEGFVATVKNSGLANSRRGAWESDRAG
jgi:hypothetical protein